MKNTKFATNKKRHISVITVMAILVVLLISLIGCNTKDSSTEDTTSVSEVASTSDAEQEATTSEPDSTEKTTNEGTEEVTNDTSEDMATTEEASSGETSDTPSSNDEPTSQPSGHTHNYSTSVTQPTCTTQGYTTYTCNCGYSYKDNYTNGSHNYSNGTCTACGAADPNWVPPHTHSWTEHTWTEDVVSGEMVNYYVCNGCGSEFTDYPSLEAHQASTGWDGTPAHTGWHNNNKWIETITQIIHHYRECACGAREDID